MTRCGQVELPKKGGKKTEQEFGSCFFKSREQSWFLVFRIENNGEKGNRDVRLSFHHFKSH